MKFNINPKYRYLELFIRQIPQQFSRSGELIYKDNDEVRLFIEKGIELVVKQYKTPTHWFKRFIYYYFQNKSKQVYETSLALIRRGFDAPTPIAYISGSKMGLLLTHNYYVSLRCPYERDFREFGDGIIAGKEPVLEAFGQLLASMHESELLLEEYSPGNIAFDVTPEGEVKFMLLNISHMCYTHIGRREGIQSFLNFPGSDEMLEVVFCAYAKAREFDPERSFKRLRKMRYKYLITKEKEEERDFQYSLRHRRKHRPKEES